VQENSGSKEFLITSQTSKDMRFHASFIEMFRKFGCVSVWEGGLRFPSSKLRSPNSSFN
jgi:hypothetical protein